MGRNYLIPALILGALSLASTALAVPESAAPTAKDQEAQIQALEKICAQLLCRKTRRDFSLHAADGKMAEGSTELYPYVDDKGAIVIYPGETVEVSLSMQDGALGLPALAAVSDPKGPVPLDFAHAPSANLSFKFQEFQKDKPGMLLTVSSQIDAIVKYDLTMFVPVRDGFRALRTSTCPMMPPAIGQKYFSGFESWPQPIFMLVVSNIRTLPKGSPMACQ